jgi:hypothetical protein
MNSWLFIFATKMKLIPKKVSKEQHIFPCSNISFICCHSDTKEGEDLADCVKARKFKVQFISYNFFTNII